MPRKSEPEVYSTRKKRGKPPQPHKNVTSLDHIVESLRPLAVPIEQLAFDPANANRHPEESIQGLMGSLASFGQRKPVVANKRTGMLEAGHGTVEAARALGLTHLAVVWVDDDPSTAAGYSIVDNQSGRLSYFDKELLKKQLEDVSTKNDPRLDALLSDMATSLKLFPVEESAAPAEDVSFESQAKFEVIVTCDSEEKQDELLAELEADGWKARKAS